MNSTTALTEQIGLSGIYDALKDPVRREMVLVLAENGEQNCSSFLSLGSKTNLSYPFAPALLGLHAHAR